jgi:hypothetical protein
VKLEAMLPTSVKFLGVMGSGVGRGGGKRDVWVIFSGVEVRLRKVRFAMLPVAVAEA